MQQNKNVPKKQKNISNLLMIQLVVMIYTLAGVAAKFASAESFFSFRFFLFYGIEIGILAVYAILWQQIIKKFDLSVAYANRSIALLWSMVWAALFFQEKITIQNIFGVFIVIAGTILVNGDCSE